MSTLSLRNGISAQRTYAVAIALLGAVATVQVVAALYLLTKRPSDSQTAAHRKAGEVRLFSQPTPSTTPATKPVKLPALEGVPSATVRRVEAPPQSGAETLLRLAKNFRERGDTTNAIAKLQEATALDPGNAEILAELALTYESMQLFDRSNQVWSRLKSLGAGAGPLSELADLKLRVGVPRSDAAGATAGSGRASEGEFAIADGATFGISEATLTREQDPEAETKLVLRVVVKVRPETAIDHTKVKIQVFFYDTVNNDQVVLTNADVNYEWVTPGHDWADTGTEVLDVIYLRPKQPELPPGTVTPAEVPDSVEQALVAARKQHQTRELLPPSESGPRQFLGYVVRLYYQDQLQAVRADPARLLDLFPPPSTIPPQ